ncbi:hypothetical protein [Kitasatospora sp. NPDC096204]|uniref:hypothetical protein n=1 Tax=Kitasatospora sp. NPDC096204 TaxID=3364094 RepID=UPI00382019BB
MSVPPVISSPLSDGAREVAGSALQATLVDLLDLALVAKQAHWNLYGPRFGSVHVQLDEVAAIAQNFSTSATVIRRLRERVGPAGEADAVTEDLLTGLIAELEKQSWMFQAENRV